VPIPKPKQGQTKDSFISSCMSDLSTEYDDVSQRYAVCIDSWSKAFTMDRFYMASFKSYTDYPDSVKNNAKAVLKYVEENGWGSCGTPVGKVRVNQLAKGEPISEETINRMYSYLSRHKVDLESSKGYGDGCGKLMYDSWGGLSALSWAESKVKSFK